ncbi:MAG TPA: glycosyltransferase, partial [Stellaceae bacterium]|nr:glycosyltransferase [Stellaceae bacterium]
AVVFPSLYEGFGLPVLEAMALGAPVVASCESALPEIAGDAALLIDPYDCDAIRRAIVTIVADADLRAELSRRGRRRAALFSLSRYRERVAALYAGLR